MVAELPAKLRTSLLLFPVWRKPFPLNMAFMSCYLLVRGMSLHPLLPRRWEPHQSPCRCETCSSNLFPEPGISAHVRRQNWLCSCSSAWPPGTSWCTCTHWTLCEMWWQKSHQCPLLLQIARVGSALDVQMFHGSCSAPIFWSVLGDNFVEYRF